MTEHLKRLDINKEYIVKTTESIERGGSRKRNKIEEKRNLVLPMLIDELKSDGPKGFKIVEKLKTNFDATFVIDHHNKS